MLLAKVQPLKDQSVTDFDCASGQLSIWVSLKMKWRNMPAMSPWQYNRWRQPRRPMAWRQHGFLEGLRRRGMMASQVNSGRGRRRGAFEV